MPLAPPNAAFAAEAIRLAQCFDAVGPLLAGTVGFAWDERVAEEDQAWHFQGGALSLSWTDERLELWGGNIGYEQTAFGGEARILIRPTGENDSMSLRRAQSVLALRALRDRGSMLAGFDAYLDLLDARHAYPSGDDEDVALFIVPFRLRLRLQTVAGTGEEALVTSYEVTR